MYIWKQVYLKRNMVVSLQEYASCVVVATVGIGVNAVGQRDWNRRRHNQHPRQHDSTYYTRNIFIKSLFNQFLWQMLILWQIKSFSLYFLFLYLIKFTHMEAFRSVRSDMLVTGWTTAKNLSNDISTSV